MGEYRKQGGGAKGSVWPSLALSSRTAPRFPPVARVAFPTLLRGRSQALLFVKYFAFGQSGRWGVEDGGEKRTEGFVPLRERKAFGHIWLKKRIYYYIILSILRGPERRLHTSVQISIHAHNPLPKSRSCRGWHLIPFPCCALLHCHWSLCTIAGAFRGLTAPEWGGVVVDKCLSLNDYRSFSPLVHNGRESVPKDTPPTSSTPEEKKFRKSMQCTYLEIKKILFASI